MTVSIDRAAVDCGGARIRTQSRHLATVVTISGAIHPLNIDRVADYTRRYILAGTPFVLDASDVNSFDPAGIPFLRKVDDDCRAAEIEWALIPSAEVDQVLRASGDDAMFPVADSLPRALRYFSDVIVKRRRLLLPLLAKSA